MFDTFNRLFPLWAVIVAMVAWFFPQDVLLAHGAVTPLLMLIMFVMGVTLSREDFVSIFRDPRAVILGLVLHFTVMPLAAWLIAQVLGLPSQLMVGMLLVGAVSSGTASNVMSWISGGNVALAVSLAIVSTLLSVILTPFIVWLLLGQSVDVPVEAMLLSIAELVLLPIVAGGVVHPVIASRVKQWEPMLASIAVAAILVIIAVVVAANVGHLASLGPMVLVAVVLHNLCGLLGGFWGGRLLRLDAAKCRSLAFEVGMQNSALAVTLANQFFSPMAGLPGAIFSVWHNISGSLLAAWWKRHPLARQYHDQSAPSHKVRKA